MSFDIKIVGAQRVGNMLRLLANQQTSITDPIVGQWSKDMSSMLKSTPYPPKRPMQAYVRIGRLANSWRAQQEKVGVWRVINMARSPLSGEQYAIHVVGDGAGQNQAWMHQGRWWIARDKILVFMPDLTGRLSRALLAYWAKNG